MHRERGKRRIKPRKEIEMSIKFNCTPGDCGAMAPEREYAWLIELEGPKWMTIIDGEPQWTDDVNKALRFARKEDADNLRAWWCMTAESTEHCWESPNV